MLAVGDATQCLPRIFDWIPRAQKEQGCERVKLTVDQRTRLGEFSDTIFKPMNWPFQAIANFFLHPGQPTGQAKRCEAAALYRPALAAQDDGM